MSAWVNGQYIQLYDPAISILDRGFTLGDGLFETMLWDGYHIRHIERHAARLKQSAVALALPEPPDAERINHIARELVERSDLTERTAALRLSWSAGPGERELLDGTWVRFELIEKEEEHDYINEFVAC